MNVRLLPLALSLAVAVGCRVSASSATTQAPGQARPATADPEPESEPSPSESTAADLSGPLEAIRRAYDVPALAAAVVTPDGVAAIGAVGVRRSDEADPVSIDDPFHLGSDTKAITTFALARLVDRGELSWDLTIAEALEEHGDQIHRKFRNVTLQQLLMHRAGMPENVEPSVLGSVDPKTAARGLRKEIARIVVSQPPVHAPGKTFLYSNTGYIVAGAMLESKVDLSWETIVQREVFDPLGMTSCGFGPTASGPDRGKPWAHAAVDGGGWEPTAVDNPAYYGPAGTVHCSLADWGRFAVEQFNEGEDAQLPPELLAHLHQGEPMPERDGGKYALGWIVASTPFAEGEVWTHDGSNTVNYASVLVIPSRKLAIVAASNAGDPGGRKAVVSAVAGLLQTFGRAAEDPEAQPPAASSMAPSTADMTASVRPPMPNDGR